MVHSNFGRIFAQALLPVPIILWIETNFFSLYKVRGESMEPTLMDGDVILVRKSDFFFTRPLLALLKSHFIISSVDHQKEEEERAQFDRLDRSDSYHIQRTDALVGKFPAFFYDSHNPLPGNVVAFRSPVEFPSVLNVKRVVALGGQRVRPSTRERFIESVPPYSLWLEGDNIGNSRDSWTYGPVSKKLVVGQAQMVMWPPSRWGAIDRVRPPTGKAWWS